MKRLLIVLVLAGCSPINSADIPKVIHELAEDDASGCFWVGGRGGGGGLTAVPGAVPGAGGYGSGEILWGRAASSDTTVTISNGNCTVRRGSALPAGFHRASVP